MNLLKGIVKFLGWLTGILAGIAAILYACGFLIVQTQFQLLGINGLMPSGDEYYFHEGANFFIVTVKEISLLVLGLTAFVLVVCIPWIFLKKAEKGAENIIRIKDIFFSIFRKHSWIWEGIILVLMIFLLFFPLIYNLDLFLAPLELSDLLTKSQDGNTSSSLSESADVVQTWLYNDDRNHLKTHYKILLMHCLFAGFLVTLTQGLTANWPLKYLLCFPFLLIFTIYLFLLPLNYAVLKKTMSFPTVTLLSTVEKVSYDSEGLFLLNKTDKEFILFDQNKKNALWIGIDKIAKVEIGQAKKLLIKNKKKRVR